MIDTDARRAICQIAERLSKEPSLQHAYKPIADVLSVPPTSAIVDHSPARTDEWWIGAIEALGLHVDTTGGFENMVIQAKLGHVLDARGDVVPVSIGRQFDTSSLRSAARNPPSWDIPGLLNHAADTIDELRAELDRVKAERVPGVCTCERDYVNDDEHAPACGTFPDVRRYISKLSAELTALKAQSGREGLVEALARHLHRQRAFSERTFGPGERTAGVLAHIRKELVEIEREPRDVSEWIDVVILALDGAWRSGHTPQEIAEALIAKQEKNEAREWPDWRTSDPMKPIEHVKRDASPTPAPKPQPAKEATNPFRWDGACVYQRGNEVWFRAPDSSKHGWPQLTNLEAERLVKFLTAFINAATPSSSPTQPPKAQTGLKWGCKWTEMEEGHPDGGKWLMLSPTGMYWLTLDRKTWADLCDSDLGLYEEFQRSAALSALDACDTPPPDYIKPEVARAVETIHRICQPSPSPDFADEEARAIIRQFDLYGTRREELCVAIAASIRKAVERGKQESKPVGEGREG